MSVRFLYALLPLPPRLIAEDRSDAALGPAELCAHDEPNKRSMVILKIFAKVRFSLKTKNKKMR